MLLPKADTSKWIKDCHLSIPNSKDKLNGQKSNKLNPTVTIDYWGFVRTLSNEEWFIKRIGYHDVWTQYYIFFIHYLANMIESGHSLFLSKSRIVCIQSFNKNKITYKGNIP